MKRIKTTMRPHDEIEVSDADYIALSRRGVVKETLDNLGTDVSRETVADTKKSTQTRKNNSGASDTSN